MAVYGISKYGAEFYGYDLPPQYRVDPFVATSINYTSVQLTWTAPAGNIFEYRLVKNRFGFPVDQDDGEILIDSLSFPGEQFVDTSVVPGEFQYYGFFVQLDPNADTWVRSGWTSCLAINNFGSGVEVNELVPDFYKQIPELSPILPQNFPTTTLDFFCLILGWGIDYIKTQYDTYLNVNNPWKISEKDLYNLAEQLGININPDIHPYTLRKAVFFNAVINKQRGTTSGINQELEALTGWAVDLTLNDNFLLENDQSGPFSPQPASWSSNITYNLNEYVTFGNFIYQCISTANYGHSPSGGNTTNTWWQVILSQSITSFINNLSTGWQNTWEAINPNVSNGIFSSNPFAEVLGIQDPLNSASFLRNGFYVTNTSGGTLSSMLVRSVARVAPFSANGPGFPPNKDQVVKDGVPTPFSIANLLVWNGTTWSPSVRYGTDQIVYYGNVPFIALRASTNVTPPISSRPSANNEWAPVSPEPRFRLCSSAYLQASTSGITATPFIEWYDSNGNFLQRITARNTTSGTNTLPIGLVYDSFTWSTSGLIGSRITDDGAFSWVIRAGAIHISPYSDGCAFPATTSQRSYATVNSGVANCQVGVTFTTAAATGDVQGLVLRWQDDNNYIRASMSEIDIKQAGAFTTLGTYSNPANVGDRLTVTLNSSTLTAFINNVQVLQVTSSFNINGTIHGIINEGSVVVQNPGSQSSNVGSQI